MTNNSVTNQGGSNADTTIQTMYQVGLRVAQNVCSIVTTPVEYALRPFFGTRYFDPIQLLFTWVLMLCLPLIGMGASYLPSGGASGRFSHGLIGLGTLSFLFFASHLIHGPRTWRRMIFMDLEQHSEYEGDAFPFFVELPLGHQFWIVRIVYEPALVFGAGVLLHLIRILDSPAMVYFIVAAVLLAVKNFLAWYQHWLRIRNLMDAKNAGPLLAKAASGTASERELAQVHLAGFPKDVPADIRMAAIAQMTPRASSLPDDIAQLISPVEPGAPRAA
jgi:hypothetical protein